MQSVGVGLALGGGGARGFSHIHALYAFEDIGVRPVLLSGTSIGAMVAVFYAAGYGAKEIEAFCSRLVKERYKILTKFLSSDYVSSAHEEEDEEFRFAEINIEKLISVILPDDFPTTFEELNLPVRLVVTDYYQQIQHVFSQGDLVPALAASCAVPGLFKPVKINGHVYVDGTAVNPVPFDVISGDVDILVGVNITGTSKGDVGVRPSKVDVLTSLSHIMQQSIICAKADMHKPDVLVRADVKGIKIYEFTKIQGILEQSVLLRETLRQELVESIAMFNKG